MAAQLQYEPVGALGGPTALELAALAPYKLTEAEKFTFDCAGPHLGAFVKQP